MIETFDLALPNGITLACRAGGSGRPRVLLLHGFPEAAFVWDEVIERLAPLRCIAPNLRGYAGSSAPADVSAYRAKPLVGDLAATIAALVGDGAPTDVPIDVLVAHDWGGALAWSLAAQRPQLLKRLVMINSPHPATFLRELRDSPAQQAASAYMNFLCRPDAAALLADDDHARLFGLFGGAGWLTDETRAKYSAVWKRGLDGALNYYRSSPLRPVRGSDDALLRVRLDDAAVSVHVPTTLLWGEQDEALLTGLLDGLERWVPRLALRRVPDASHWIVHEQPALVAATIRAAVDAADGA